MKKYLQRKLDFHPGYDKRDPDPSKNYGIHGMDMRFLLSGKIGTVQFVLFTNWMIASVRKEHDQFEKVSRFLTSPLPADVGYHSRVPQYDGQTPVRKTKIFPTKKDITFEIEGEEIKFPEIKIEQDFELTPCEYLHGDPCFYDGSGLAAQQYFDVLVSEGDEALWLKLEEYYDRALGDESHWLRVFNIFKAHDIEGKDLWFYIYKHRNGGWEKSFFYFSKTKVIAAKIKSHLRVYYRKTLKFITGL